MISIIKKGVYEIIETRFRTKIIYLDDKPFAWLKAKNIGEILVSSHRARDSDVKVSTGKYLLYDVDDEDYLTDLQHLELEYGQGAWQGYLLPTGLPHDEKKRARIIPTHQLITNIDYFMKHLTFRKPKVLIHSIETPA